MKTTETKNNKICQYKNNDKACKVGKNKSNNIKICPIFSRPADCGYCFIEDNEEYAG